MYKGRLAALSLAATGSLLACASTTVEITGDALKQPICQPGSAPLTAAVLWTTRWRPDQKEPALREAAALRGIQVVVDVRVLRSSETLASSQTHWWNGGTFVIKGVTSLDHDMSEALTSTLLPKPAD